MVPHLAGLNPDYSLKQVQTSALSSLCHGDIFFQSSPGATADPDFAVPLSTSSPDAADVARCDVVAAHVGHQPPISSFGAPCVDAAAEMPLLRGVTTVNAMSEPMDGVEFVTL